MKYILERLAWADMTSSDRAGEPDTFNVREAVIQQIQRVVGSHFAAGTSGLDLMEFDLMPLPGINASQNDLTSYASAIGRLVKKHEPRLQISKISVEKSAASPTRYQVVINGSLTGEQKRDTFRFDFLPGG